MPELTSRRIIRRQLARILLAPLLLLLAALVVLVWQVRDLKQGFQLAHNADLAISQARLVLRTAVDQESSFRAYLLVHDPQFLRKFQEDQRKLKDRTDQLCEQLKNNDVQEDRCQQLYRDYADFDAIAQSAFTQVQHGSRKIRLADVVLRGKKEIEDFRRTQDDLVKAEEAIRAAKYAETQRDARRLDIAVIIVAAFFGIALLLETLRNIRLVDREYGSVLADVRVRARELQDSRERLDVTLRSIADGVIVTDNDGTVRFLNAAAERITGHDRFVASGRPITEIYLPLRGPSGHLQINRPDGATVLIEESASAIHSTNGLIIGTVVVLRDITERQTALERLRQSERLAVAGRLSASIAHEIHNPLDTVGNLLYLLERSNDDELRVGLLHSAKRELARVIQITKGMLGLYRQSRTPAEVSIEDCVQGIILLVSARARAKTIELKTDFQTERKAIGYPAEIRQMLLNLVSNGIDASPERGKLTITVTNAELPDSAAAVCISVSDCGPGISPEVQGRLFRPFVTSKGQDGTGLGLWITYELVQKHGGTIAVTSNSADGQGTTFTICLPAGSGPASASPAPPEQQAVTETTAQPV